MATSVNRYTQYRPARYTPRTLQELMVVPAYKRQQHNQLNKDIATLDTYLETIQNLDVHDDVARAERERLESALNKQMESLSTEGFNQSNRSNFINFNSDYQNAIGSNGILGKVSAARQSYIDARKQIIDEAIKEGHDPQASLSQLAKQYQSYTDQFNESGEIVNFIGQRAPKYIDFQEDLKFVKGQLGETVKTSRGNEGYNIIRDPSTNRLVIQTESGQVITEDNNEQIKSALNHLESKWLNEEGAGYKSDQWNLINPQYRLDQIVSGLSMMHESSIKDTRQNRYDFSALKDLNDQQRKEGNLSYENVPVETMQVRNSELSDLLSKVIKGEVRPQSSTGYIGSGMDLKMDIASGNYAAIQDAAGKDGKPFLLNDADDTQLQQYRSIASGLRESGVIPTNIESNSKEEMVYVRDYIEANQALSHNNKLITSDLITVYGEGSEGIKETTPKALGEDISLHYKYRTFYNPETGDIIEGDDLDEDIINALKGGKIKVSGYYSPKNLWSTTIAKDSDQNMFTSPIEIQVATEDDGVVTLLASRKSSKTNSPAYNADTKFSKIYAKTNTTPNIPTEFNIGGINTKIARVQKPNPASYKSNSVMYEQLMKNYNSAVTQAAQIIENTNELSNLQKQEKLRKLYSGQASLYITNGENNSDPIVFMEDDLRATIKNIYGAKNN